MDVTQRSRLNLRLQSGLFVVLFLGIIGTLGWLSKQYHLQSDWTASGRHTLSKASTDLLKRLKGPLQITAYARELEPLRQPIRELVARYRQAKPDITLKFVNPDTAPDAVRANNITTDGELVVHYQGKSENLREPGEQALSNALQRLARTGNRNVAYLTGHGERSLQGHANHDLDGLGQQLAQKGFSASALNLATTPAVPGHTALLIVAAPQTDLLPGEIQLIQKYVEQGGNLLWLIDPGPQHGLQTLAQSLGVTLEPGVVVDPSSQLLGISDPRFAVVADYPEHPVTQGFKTITLFPRAGGLSVKAAPGWKAEPLLSTVPRSWLETSPIVDQVGFDTGKDKEGPITLALALTRSLGDAKAAREQRVIVVANGDFLANSFLGNGGNLDLGLNMINWLAHDDALLNIPARTAPDRQLTLSPGAQIGLFAGFLVLLPLALLGSGVTIWWRRRRK